MRLRFVFAGPLEPERVHAALRAVAPVLAPGEHAWEQVEGESPPDRNGGAPLFRARWRSDRGAELRASLENGSGNPRDGWGYHAFAALEVGESELRVAGAAWERRFRDARFEGALPAEAFDAVRAALADALGTEDRTDAPPWAAENARALLRAGRRDEARALLRRSKEKHPEAGPERARLLSELEGPSVALLRERLPREGTDPALWEALAALGGDRDVAPADALLLAATLAPWDAARARAAAEARPAAGDRVQRGRRLLGDGLAALGLADAEPLEDALRFQARRLGRDALRARLQLVHAFGGSGFLSRPRYREEGERQEVVDVMVWPPRPVGEGLGMDALLGLRLRGLDDAGTRWIDLPLPELLWAFDADGEAISGAVISPEEGAPLELRFHGPGAGFRAWLLERRFALGLEPKPAQPADVVFAGGEGEARTLEEGLAMTPPGGTLVLAKGLEPQGPLVLDRPLTLFAAWAPRWDLEAPIEVRADATIAGLALHARRCPYAIRARGARLRLRSCELAFGATNLRAEAGARVELIGGRVHSAGQLGLGADRESCIVVHGTRLEKLPRVAEGPVTLTPDPFA